MSTKHPPLAGVFLPSAYAWMELSPGMRRTKPADSDDEKYRPGEPVNHSARARRRNGERLRPGLGKCGLAMIECFCPNERPETRRRPRKGPSRMGFAGKDPAHARHHEAAAAATFTRAAAHNLRFFRAKRAPCRVIQRSLVLTSTISYGNTEVEIELSTTAKLR